MKRPLALVALLMLTLAWGALGAAGCIGDDTAPAQDVGAPLDVGDVDAAGDTAGDAADADTLAEIDEPCHGPDECVDGASCIGTGQPNDYLCMKNCQDAGRICEDGSVCTPRIPPAEPICYTAGTTARGDRCETNLDCVPGTLCYGTSAERYCLRACHDLDPGACPDASFCKLGSSGTKGLCRDHLGAECAASGQCYDGLLCTGELDTAIAQALPGGYCTMPDCDTDSDCPFDGACRTLPSTSRSICLATCATDGDCRFNQDYRCVRDGSCEQATDPDGCEALRDGANICLPVQLFSE